MSVSNVCNAVPISLFWALNRLNELYYWNCVWNFLSFWLANRQWLSKKSSHGAHSYSSTHVGPRTMISVLLCRRTLPGGLVSSVSQATYFLTWRYFTLLRVKAKIKNTHATTGTVVYLIPWNIMKKSYSQELQEVWHLKEQCHKDIAVSCQFWTEVIT